MKNVLLMSLVLGLGACSLVQPKEKVKTVVVSIPESLLLPCNAKEPPERDTIIGVPVKQQLITVTEYALENMKRIQECNDRITVVRELNQKFKELKNE